MELNNTEMKMQYILDENKNLAEIPLTDMLPVEHPINKLLESLGVTAEQWEEPDVMGF